MRSTMLALLALGLLLAIAAGVPATRAILMGWLPPTWRIALSAWRHGIEVDHGVRIATPDGVELGASLYRPKGTTVPLPHRSGA